MAGLKRDAPRYARHTEEVDEANAVDTRCYRTAVACITPHGTVLHGNQQVYAMPPVRAAARGRLLFQPPRSVLQTALSTPCRFQESLAQCPSD